MFYMAKRAIFVRPILSQSFYRNILEISANFELDRFCRKNSTKKYRLTRVSRFKHMVNHVIYPTQRLSVRF